MSTFFDKYLPRLTKIYNRSLLITRQKNIIIDVMDKKGEKQ